MDSVPIDKLLKDAGLVGAEARARALLEEHGLTTPRKQNIAVAKLARARQLFAAHLRPTCGDPICERLAAAELPDREPVTVAPAGCAICGGSSQRRAVRLLADCLGRAGLQRVLLLGGSPPQHTALQQLLAGGALTVRAIDGSARAHSAAEAAQHLAWAELLVIWASTPLHHKVSVPYTSQAPAGMPVITVARRGVEALCQGIVEAIERQRR